MVFPAATLTIQPGTIIEFNPGEGPHQLSPEFPAAPIVTNYRALRLRTQTARRDARSLTVAFQAANYEVPLSTGSLSGSPIVAIVVHDAEREISKPYLPVPQESVLFTDYRSKRKEGGLFVAVQGIDLERAMGTRLHFHLMVWKFFNSKLWWRLFK